MMFRNTPILKGQGLYVSLDRSLLDHHVFRLEVVGYPAGIAGLRMWMFGSLFLLVLTDQQDAFAELERATYRPGRIIAAKTRNAVVLSWPVQVTDTTLTLRMSDPAMAAD
jgi:hypothetical protein